MASNSGSLKRKSPKPSHDSWKLNAVHDEFADEMAGPSTKRVRSGSSAPSTALRGTSDHRANQAVSARSGPKPLSVAVPSHQHDSAAKQTSRTVLRNHNDEDDEDDEDGDGDVREGDDDDEDDDDDSDAAPDELTSTGGAAAAAGNSGDAVKRKRKRKKDAYVRCCCVSIICILVVVIHIVMVVWIPYVYTVLSATHVHCVMRAVAQTARDLV